MRWSMKSVCMFCAYTACMVTSESVYMCVSVCVSSQVSKPSFYKQSGAIFVKWVHFAGFPDLKALRLGLKVAVQLVLG